MKIFNKLNIVLFVIFFIAIYIEEWDSIISFFKQAGPIALALNITMMVIAFYLAKCFASGIAQTKCYFIRVWFTKWNISHICFNSNIWSDILYATPTAAYGFNNVYNWIYICFSS